MTIHTSHRSKETQWVPSIERKALSQSVHAGKVRLRAGDQWLHWAAGFLTSDPKQAWSGSIEQARRCRAAFSAAAGCKAEEVP